MSSQGLLYPTHSHHFYFKVLLVFYIEDILQFTPQMGYSPTISNFYFASRRVSSRLLGPSQDKSLGPKS